MPTTNADKASTDTATTAAPSTNLPARTRPARRSGQQTSADKHDHDQHRRAVQHAVEANTTQIHLDLGPAHLHLSLPPLDKMAFYAGLGGAAALGVIEWPIAILTGVGHLLSDNRRHRTLAAVGEALDAV